jgi:pilin isopeptide linkage protein
VTDNGDGTVTVTWGENGTATVKGSASPTNFHYRWEGPAGFYNYGPPQAHLVDGAVDWNLSSVGTLLNGVTYTVTFDVYPSQTALDWKAKLENGENYDEVVPAAAQPYFDEYGMLATNTTATLSYKDTRLPEGQQAGSATFAPPDRVVTKDETMVVTKDWEGDNPPAEGQIELDIIADGDTDSPFEQALLGPDPNWTKEIHISCGIMKDGEVMPGAEGHDFTFAELPSVQYRWEIEAPTVHPMIIDGVTHMLVKVDEAHPIGDKTPIMIGGSQYYIDESVTSLTAINHRRSNLNLAKVVTAEDGATAPADATFPFTMTVVNSKKGNGSADDINSDYYVWFSIMNGSDFVERTTSATSRPDPDTGTPYYYAESGTAITVELKDGDSLRFTNLPSGSTYTFTEQNVTGFKFVSAENTGPEGSTFNVDGKTVTGTIDSYNAISYGAKYTNAYGTTDVTVSKVWDDGDNQDNIRPTDLDLTLVGYTGTPVPTPAVTKNGNTWTYTWEDLPKYGTADNEIAYQVTEENVPEGYTCDETTVSNNGTITNKHEPVNTSVTATKAWDDADDQDGIRPDKVSVQLYAGNDAYGDPVELDGSGETPWTYTWKGLPKNEGGSAIVYTVDETAVPSGYEKTGITGSVEDGFTITNKHTPEVVDITVTKEWVGPEAGAVQAQLYAGEEAVGEPVTLDSGHSWTYTWEDQPVYANGQKISYKVDEVTTPTGYEKQVTGSAEAGFTITNTNTEKVEKTVKKVWHDGENQDGIRPETLSVQLKANGENYGDPVVLEDGLNWIHKESGLPKYDAQGSLIEYTWVEVTDSLSEGYEPDGSSVDGDTTTLYNKHTPATTSVTVTKAWDDSNNAEGVRPGSVSVQLLAGGEAVGDAVTLDGDHGWTYTWENQPVNKAGQPISYTVDETEVPKGYTKVGITGDVESGFTITNKYTPAATEYELSAGKKLAVEEPADNPPDVSGKYTLTLEAVGNAPMPEGAVDGKVEIANADGDGTMTSFGKIPFVTPGEYQYTVSESGTVDGVTNGPTSSTVKVKVSGTTDGGLACTVTEGSQETLFTNTYKVTPATATIEASKSLAGAPLSAGAFEFELVDGDGEQVATATNGGDGKVSFPEMTFDAPGTYTYTMREIDEKKDGFTYDSHEVTVTVSVADNGEGKLVATPAYKGATEFKNSYKADGTVDLSVEKEYTNGTLESGQFTFELVDEKGEVIQTKTNNESGAVIFDPISYDESIFDKAVPAPDDEGDFKPAADEEEPAAEASADDEADEPKAAKTGEDAADEETDDSAEADEPVTSDDSGDATSEGDGEDGESADDQASATKVMTGAEDGEEDDEADEGEDASFEPEADGDDGDTDKTRTATVTYTIREVKGDESYIVYDPGDPITVTVTVVDNGDGSITATPAYSRTKFTNAYKASGSATFEGAKTLTGAELAEGQFSFQLIGADNKVIQTVENAADGSFSFDSIAYDQTDIGKTYEYQIVEVNDGEAGYVYDDHACTVSVKVSDLGEGKLDCEVTLSDGEKAAFENSFKPLATSAQLKGHKTLRGRDLIEGEFEFELANENGDIVSIATNDASGNIDFGTFDFEEVGTYTYTATEVKGSEEYITYDESEQEFTVEVTLDGGELKAEVSCGEGDTAEFTNVFDVPDPIEPDSGGDGDDETDNPGIPDEPNSAPDGDNSGGNGSGKSPLPHTGDAAPVIPLLALALGATAVLIVLTARRILPAGRGQRRRTGKHEKR